LAAAPEGFAQTKTQTHTSYMQSHNPPQKKKTNQQQLQQQQQQQQQNSEQKTRRKLVRDFRARGRHRHCMM